MKINSDFIEDVKGKLDIVDVIGDYITLKKAGINYKGICPFHNDSHPSMMVSKVRQTYHCFVCGEHGDVLDFLQKYNQVTFTEALRLACKKANIDFPEQETTPEENAAYKQMEARRIAIGAAAKFYQANLFQAESFLKSRGYDPSDKVLAEYGVGYAPMGNVALKQLTSQGYSTQLLAEVGVLGKSQDGRRYDFFRDRVMFPFYDLSGRVVAFSGRIVTPNENTGKYVNTGETPLFRKGKHLFGLFQAKRAIAKEGFAYLVEGQFDVMTLHKYGVENVIGGSGTAFTDDQVRLIMRFAQSVVVIYDADAAGTKAAIKNCELLLKAGATVRCVRLPKGQDPDSYARLCKDYDRGGYNGERSSLSTIEQNLRSHPSYIGQTTSHRFTWEETMEVAKQDDQETMVRVRKQLSTVTSAIVMDYDKFMEMYAIDFRRGEFLADETSDNAGKDSNANRAGKSNQEASASPDNSGYVPGNLPFSETDAGDKGDEPF